MKALLFTFLLVLCSPASAQVFKCTVKGKTIYSGTPCGGGPALDVNTSSRTVENSTSASAAESPYDRELRALISKALVEEDFKKAESLAVTEDHWNMITEAKDKKRQLAIEKKKARASQSRPLSCFSQTLVSGRIYKNCK